MRGVKMSEFQFGKMMEIDHNCWLRDNVEDPS